MPQNPILGTIVTQSKKLAAPALIKAAAGTIVSITVDTPGSAGNLTLNDVATLGGAGSGNQVWSRPFGNLVAGDTYTLIMPTKAGIVLSAIPTGGQVRVQFA